MIWEFMGKVNLPDGLIVQSTTIIKGAWYFLCHDPRELGIYYLYKVDPETATATPAEIL